MALIETLKQRFSSFEDDCLGVLLWGSHVEGGATDRSDVDICLVAGEGRERVELLRKAWREVDPRGLPRMDIHVFEELPMFLKARVLEHHIVLVAMSEPYLYEHLYFYRKLWDDQKHRQQVTDDEARRIIAGDEG